MIVQYVLVSILLFHIFFLWALILKFYCIIRRKIFIVSLFSSEKAPTITQRSISFMKEIQEQGNGNLYTVSKLNYDNLIMVLIKKIQNYICFFSHHFFRFSCFSLQMIVVDYQSGIKLFKQISFLGYSVKLDIN